MIMNQLSVSSFICSYVLFFILLTAGACSDVAEEAIFPFKVENGKFGGISAKGNLVVPPIYDSIGGFYRKHAIYQMYGVGFGIVSSSGQEVTPPHFRYLMGFEGGVITFGVKDNEEVLVDTSGNVLQCNGVENWGVAADTILYYKEDSSCVFLNKDCEKLFRIQAERYLGSNSRALAFGTSAGCLYTDLVGDTILFIPGNNTRCGYIMYDDYVVIVQSDTIYSYFFNGRIERYAIEKDSVNNYGVFISGKGFVSDSKGILRGIYDRTGKLIAEPVYGLIGQFHDGLAYVLCDNLKTGFINEAGELVIPCKFDSGPWFDGFKEGVAMMNDSNNLMIFIDKKGKVLFKEPKPRPIYTSW